MKIKILKSVVSSAGWRNEGEIHDLESKVARHYISKGIGIEYKEEKVLRETKEEKSTKKRITKKSK